MGIGLVLVFWAAAGAVMATPVAIALILLARWSGGAARSERVLSWLVGAAARSVVYAAGAFVVYAVWCGVFRGVDPGIGDWWGVPLANGYSLSFIDVPDRAYIAPRGETDGQALVADITQIGVRGDLVFGALSREGGFVLDTRTGDLRRVAWTTLPALLAAMGVPETQLLGVREFYLERRWGWPDALALLILGVPPLVLGARTLRMAWREPGEQAG